MHLPCRGGDALKWGKVLPVFLVVMLAAETSFAAGFRLPEAGAKAMGMGFAFTAQADDPSAIYFNPAGLTQLEGRNVMLGGAFVQLYGSTFEGITPLTGGASATERQKTLQYVVPNFYYTRTYKESGLAWGIGVYSPFGLSQQYESWTTSVFRNQSTKIELKMGVVNPTIAFDIDECLSVGFGIDYMYGTARFGRTPVSGIGNVYEFEQDGKADAWGYNFGILLKPAESFRIGASFRSGFELDSKNEDTTLTGIHPAVAGLFGGGAAFRTKGSATVNVPATFALGAAYTRDRLTVEADADWTFWSSYRNLMITIRDEVRNPATGGPVLVSTNSEKDWRDVCAFRFGAEYRATDRLALRAGFAYDPSPAPAETLGPELPDADRLNYMLGVGYRIGAWTIDLAGMYIDKKDRRVSNLAFDANGSPIGMDGEWSGDAWLAGLDLTYSF